MRVVVGRQLAHCQRFSLVEGRWLTADSGASHDFLSQGVAQFQQKVFAILLRRIVYDWHLNE